MMKWIRTSKPALLTFIKLMRPRLLYHSTLGLRVIKKKKKKSVDKNMSPHGVGAWSFAVRLGVMGLVDGFVPVSST